MTTSNEALTERQQQVLDLLNKGKGAREIGTILEITRNAVYQNINRLKAKGALPESFVPESGSGTTSARALSRITGQAPAKTPAHDGGTGNPLVLQLLDELAQTQQELAGIANRLAKYLQ